MQYKLIKVLFSVVLLSTTVVTATSIPTNSTEPISTEADFIQRIETDTSNRKIEIDLSENYTYDSSSEIILQDKEGNIIETEVSNITSDEIYITTSTDLVDGEIYTLTIKNLVDSSGNQINSSITFIADPNVETVKYENGKTETLDIFWSADEE